MSIKVRVGATLRTASAIQVKISGAMRTVRSIRVMVAGVLQPVYLSAGSLSASASPSSVFGTTTESLCVTDSTSVSPSGGVGPFTYSWALVSHSGGNTPVISSSSLASTTFYQVKLGSYDESNTATFRCTVTDAFAATTTVDVAASFEFFTTA